MLLVLTRGELVRIDLPGNAGFHRSHLARMPGRTTAEGVLDAMLREAEGLGTRDVCHNWSSSVASLILASYGDSGTLDLWEEYRRLESAYRAEQEPAAIAA